MKQEVKDILGLFPRDLADSLVDMALDRLEMSRERLPQLTQGESDRLDETLLRLIRADDVPDTPCGDSATR